MNRYIDGSADLITVFTTVLNRDFPNLAGIRFKLVFDTKKRMSKGKLILASTELVNEKLRFFTSDEDAPEGFDYITTVDSVAWEYASPEDKERIVSHELNHVFIDEKGKLKLVSHDVEDFAREVQKNASNPGWAQDLALVTQTIYEQSEEQGVM